MLLAKNKKFEKLTTNPNYLPQEDIDQIVHNEQKHNSVNSKKRQGASFAFTKTLRKTVLHAHDKSPVAPCSMSPFVLLFSIMCLVLISNLLTNTSFYTSLSYKERSIFSIISSVVCYVVPSAVYVLSSPKRIHPYYVKPFSVSYVPLAFATLGLVICSSALQKYFIAYTFSYRVPVGTAPENLVLALVTGALLPALVEEVLLRGIFEYEISKYAGGIAGIVVSAFAFSLLHFDIQFFVIYFVAGLILASLTNITGSVLPSAAVHFVNNAIVILFSDRLTLAALERIGGYFLMIVLCVLCFVFLLVFLKLTENIAVKRAKKFYALHKAHEEKPISEADMYFFFTKPKDHILVRFLYTAFSPMMIACYVLFIVVVAVVK